MAGWNHEHGKSNNAVKAEKDGRLPATKFAKLARKEGYKGCTAWDVKNAIAPSEWHHTSKYYNVTEYYDWEYFLTDEDEQEALLATIRRRKEYDRLFRLLSDGKDYVQLKAREDGIVKDWYRLYQVPRKRNVADLEKMQEQERLGFVDFDIVKTMK